MGQGRIPLSLPCLSQGVIIVAIEKEYPGHPDLTGGGETPLHTHPGGGGASLVVSGTTVFTGDSPTSWTSLDLSGVIGANNFALVILQISATGDMDATAVRRRGDTAEYYNPSVEASAYGCALGHHDSTADLVLLCVTSEGGRIEWITENSMPATIKLIAYIKMPLVPESGINVGADPIDRIGSHAWDYTIVDKNNPANASGTLHSVKVYAAINLEGLIVGTFYPINGTTFKCRDSVAIGSVEAGAERTFTGLSITVVEGDYIGCYYTGGAIEMDQYLPFAGIWRITGEYIDPGDEAEYVFYDERALSLYGYGDI